MNSCQMFEGDELIECGFLVGGTCRANPKKPMRIDQYTNRLLSIVGCQSYQRYLDYGERRKRFGTEAVTGTDEGTSCSKANWRENPVQKLQEPEVGGSRGTESGDGSKTVPMRVLPQNPYCEGHPVHDQPTGHDLKCKFCGEPAVKTDCGIHYCKKCAEKIGL